MQAIMERQQKELQEFLMQQSLNAPVENATFSFKRLPFWSGWKSNEENLVNFEWPTQDMLAQIAPDVTLKSIEFST